MFCWRVVVLLVLTVAELAELVTPSSSPAPRPAAGSWAAESGGAAVHIRLVGQHHLSAAMAGGDVILGGFAFALVASIFCYIRVTRRNQSTSTSKPEGLV